MIIELVAIFILAGYSTGAAINKTSMDCGPNGVFELCASACPLTCAQPSPRPCIQACGARCVCRNGYYLASLEGSQCVSREDCARQPEPSCKGDRQSFSECASLCPVTCQLRKPPGCPSVCVKGCVCEPDHILDQASGNCVKVADCPAE